MSKKKILVVEDNSINRAMLAGILVSQYEVLEAENGQEALCVLEQYKDEISLILLDIIMPVMDGYTFLSIMKENPSYASVPVIVTTQNDGESDEVAALSQGAADFVGKPYKPQIILHRVASIINLRETAAMVNQFKYDRLTGLYGKEYFYKSAKEYILKNPEKQYDIVCSDIENFKLINDVFGVSAGDALLCGIAQIYTRYVNAHGICSHFHADQFVCLMEHDGEYTDELFAQINAQINALTKVKNVSLKWGVYAISSAENVPVEQMCDRALLAARSIKGQYGKYFSYYDATLRNQLLRNQEITDEMEKALLEEQFVVYLQPKYKTTTRELCGAEALVRWIHPEWGFQSPGEFIPLFEKNGFITKLDQYVWEKVCMLLHEWDRKGLRSIPVSVNVSRADIYNVNLADILKGLAETYELEPSRIHLEVTESAYTEDPKQIIETMGNLRDLGFLVEMDDFGSGYSSLNMLNQLPLDVLKLDMKFIQNEMAKPAEQGILRFIMELAHWMNLYVVAEGVESEEQLERLGELGCDYVQGYYLAKPMPGTAFEQLLQQLNSIRGME
ncbi:MAG: EAL domain-containing protein [Peptococcaceae bacterium]